MTAIFRARDMMIGLPFIADMRLQDDERSDFSSAAANCSSGCETLSSAAARLGTRQSMQRGAARIAVGRPATVGDEQGGGVVAAELQVAAEFFGIDVDAAFFDF